MQIEIGVIGALVGVLISYLTFIRSRDKDVTKEATKDAVLETKLNNIGQGVESIRVDLKVHERNFTDLTGRVIRIEESAKQAHKRLDGLEKECN